MSTAGCCRWLAALAVAALLIGPGVAEAQAPAACTAEDFAKTVDKSGAALRAFTLEVQPKLQAKIRRFGEIKKLETSAVEGAALDAIQDAELSTLNEKSASLLLEIDTLGRTEEGKALDCSRIKEIERLSSELMAVMREKSTYMLAKLDSKIAEAGGGAEKPAAKVAEKPAEKPPAKTAEKPAPKPEQKPKAEKPAQVAVKREPAPTAKEGAPSGGKLGKTWSTETSPNDAYSPPPAGGKAPPPGSGDVALALDEDGYSIDEIRDATKGFFGTISTNLAAVIEHAFKTSGRPTAYVLGTEGGGAFFAGLRFGKGTLFLRHQSYSQPIYWHGPSLGTDFGAAGSRTMFLIYKLSAPNQLLRTFTGIDGSAYLVGGVGLTLLKGGDVIMAPIRSGIGLRLGANIGYLRFSDHPTWNPF